MSVPEKIPHITIVDDRFWKSAARDFVTLMVGIIFMGVGSLLDNSAMEVVGLVYWMLFVFGWSAAMLRKSRKTIEEARAFLDQIDGSQ